MPFNPQTGQWIAQQQQAQGPQNVQSTQQQQGNPWQHFNAPPPPPQQQYPMVGQNYVGPVQPGQQQQQNFGGQQQQNYGPPPGFNPLQGVSSQQYAPQMDQQQMMNSQMMQQNPYAGQSPYNPGIQYQGNNASYGNLSNAQGLGTMQNGQFMQGQLGGGNLSMQPSFMNQAQTSNWAAQPVQQQPNAIMDSSINQALAIAQAQEQAQQQKSSAISDISAKTNVSSADSDVQSFLDSLSAYEYKYKDKDYDNDRSRISVMAQDLDRTPIGKAALTRDEKTGYLKVDYGRLLGTQLAATAHINHKLNDLSDVVYKKILSKRSS